MYNDMPADIMFGGYYFSRTSTWIFIDGKHQACQSEIYADYESKEFSSKLSIVLTTLQPSC